MHHLSHHESHAHQAFASYAGTLQEDRRVLLERYHRRDVAFKTVGVGSVGTFCAIALFVSDDGAPLLLQIKEAQQSVLEAFAGASAYSNHGQRVIVGERMMQAATDVFLGWTQNPLNGRYFYVRRLKDSRLANIGTRLEAELPFYAALCGPHPGSRSCARAMRWRCRLIWAMTASSTNRSRNSRWLTPIRRSAIGTHSWTRSRRDGLAPRSSTLRQLDTTRASICGWLTEGFRAPEFSDTKALARGTRCVTKWTYPGFVER